MEKKYSGFKFDNTYLELNKNMFSVLPLGNTYDSTIKILNNSLAKELDLDINYLKSIDGKKLLSGSVNEELKSGFAQAYSGHQFGHFTTLGDGRALFLGEHVTKSLNRVDIQLKGSGLTPYSRGGDGKATLSSMLREYMISESIHHLNIPTTRILAVLKTNEKVRREVYQDGAILTRVAKSHIRVGTFEFAYANSQFEEVKRLADYTINRHYSDLNSVENKYYEFLLRVIDKQASLVAKWQSVGFIHGVLNTDNVLISGETIDYGPCAFMNEYNPKTVFSSIDKQGRYSYFNQPYITSWNIARFTETIIPLIDKDMEKALKLANDALSKYEILYKKYWLSNMTAKIGISEIVNTDKLLIQELLDIMQNNKLDFTNTFRLLTLGDYTKMNIIEQSDLKSWINKWEERLKAEKKSLEESIVLMKSHNPNVIPRNTLVEEALKRASKLNDYELYNEMIEVLRDPYNYDIEYDEKLLSSENENRLHVTYCGT